MAGLLATPGCERRSRLVTAGADLDALAVSLGAAQSGQSPFALARSAQFEARVRSQEYADLRALITEHLGIAVESVVDGSGLPAVAADSGVRLHVLGPQRLPLGEGVLDLDSALLVSGPTVHLVGIRTYAMLGEVADPAKVAATARELAVAITALRGELAERLSTRTLLVLPRNFGLKPTASVLDVAPGVARVRGLLARLEWGGEPRIAELAPRFGDGCTQCALMSHCAGELERSRSVGRLGPTVANLVEHPSIDEALPDAPPDLAVRLRLRAAVERRAVRRATVRHTHVAAAPFVVAGYHLAGEPAAVLALHYGTSPDGGKLVVADEPRDRDRRMAALREFALDLNAYAGGFEAVEPVVRRDMSVVECSVDAPQIVVPNAATAHWLTDVLGRYLRASDDPDLQLAGRHLGWYASRRVLPGSDALVAATTALSTHWVTGGLPAEESHLPYLLAWQGLSVADQPAGPVTDPSWDSALAPLLGTDGVRAAVEPLTTVAWGQTWASLELLRTLGEPGGHVADRWERDRWSFTSHRQRIAEGTAAYAARLSGVPAYRFLHELETRTVALERQMALDDPLVMSGYLLSGDALGGTVAKVDREHTLASPTGRELLRPRIWLATETEFARPLGTQLWLAADPRVMATVTAVEPASVELTVQKGAVQRNALGRLPQAGEAVVFAPFGGEDVFPAQLPEALPWQFGVVADE